MKRVYRAILIPFIAILAAAWWWSGLLHWPPSKPVINRPWPAWVGEVYEWPDDRLLLQRLSAQTSLQADAGFAEVIEQLHKSANIEISVNWQAVEEAGFNRHTRVSLNAANAPIGSVLTDLLFSVDPTHRKLRFSTDMGVVYISTPGDFTANVVTQVYDARGVIKAYRTASRPLTIGQLLGSDAQNTPARFPESLGKFTDTELVKCLASCVDPDSWKANGGRMGSMRCLSGQLIVTQSSANHRMIDYELRRLRWRYELIQFGVSATPLVLAAMLLAFVLELLRRRRALAMIGLCPQCGYDLRATPDRCPECGHSVAVAIPQTVSDSIDAQV